MADTPEYPSSRRISPDELPEWAALVALDAVDEDERAGIDDALGAAPPQIRAQYEALLREHREALADYSATSAVDPPGHVLARVLERLDATDAADDGAGIGTAEVPDDSGPVSLEAARTRRQRRTRRVIAAATAAAAAVIIAIGGVVISEYTEGGPNAPTTQSVLAEPDMHKVETTVGDGTASVAFSRDANAAVFVMNGVPPPDEGSVYQLWLLGSGHEPESVGMMGPQDVHPRTQALIDGIADATGLGISVEPTGGSAQPTDVVATISLT